MANFASIQRFFEKVEAERAATAGRGAAEHQGIAE